LVPEQIRSQGRMVCSSILFQTVKDQKKFH